jgi:hypothetical protein
MGNTLVYKLAYLCKSRRDCTCSVPNDWLVDSGATIHLLPVKSDFIDLTIISNKEEIKTADRDTSLIIRGCRIVLI